MSLAARFGAGWISARRRTRRGRLFGWVSDERHEIEYIAEAGVFLLLFSIGLEFSLDELWRLGRNLVIGGSVQMLLVALPVGAFCWEPAGIGSRPC